MASNAVFSVQHRAAVFIQADGLMPAVGAGDFAAPAADAALPQEFGEHHGVPFQRVGGGAEGIQAHADQLADMMIYLASPRASTLSGQAISIDSDVQGLV